MGDIFTRRCWTVSYGRSLPRAFVLEPGSRNGSALAGLRPPIINLQSSANEAEPRKQHSSFVATDRQLRTSLPEVPLISSSRSLTMRSRCFNSEATTDVFGRSSSQLRQGGTNPMGQILSPGRKSRTRHIEYLRHFICRWDGQSPGQIP